MKNLYIKVPGKFRLECKFTTAYLKVWRELGNWGFKISDADRSIKPADVILADKTGMYLVEFKRIDSNILHIGDLRPSQMKAGRTISRLCGRSLVIVYSIKYNKYKIIDFKDIIKKKDKGEMEIRLLF